MDLKKKLKRISNRMELKMKDPGPGQKPRKKNRRSGLNWKKRQTIFAKKIQYRHGEKKPRHGRQ